jgi:uncharacterized protein (UPF0179 family)
MMVAKDNAKALIFEFVHGLDCRCRNWCIDKQNSGIGREVVRIRLSGEIQHCLDVARSETLYEKSWYSIELK